MDPITEMKIIKIVGLTMTSAIRTLIRVDVDAAISAIIVTVSIIGLIIAEPVSNQCTIVAI